MQKYNLKHSFTPNVPPTNPPICFHPHRSPGTAHIKPRNPHLLPTKHTTTKPMPLPSIYNIGITLDVSPTPTQKGNLQYFLSQIEHLLPGHHPDFQVNPDLGISVPSATHVTATN